MHDPLGVRRLQRVAGWDEQLGHLVELERARPFAARRERLALQQLHDHDGRAVGVLEYVEDLDHVRVLDRGGGARLAHEATNVILSSAGLRVNELERDLLACGRVARGVHLSHAPTPNQPLHLEAPSDDRPFGERASLLITRHVDKEATSRGGSLTVISRLPEHRARVTRRAQVGLVIGLAALVLGLSTAWEGSVAFAQAAPSDGASRLDEDATARGRRAFVRGQSLAKDEQWGDALAAFQEAAAARDAPLVQFSIAYCERALGRYVAARKTLLAVVASLAAAGPATGGGLDPAQIEDTKAYLAEFDKLIVRVAVKLDPPSATLTVDGRPLLEGDAKDTYLAGVAPAGVGTPFGKPSFALLLDPGAHLLRAVRQGHQDALVSKSYRPGEQATLDLRLDVLPATVAIRSEPGAAIVRVDSREVGLSPIEFERPAGQYKLEVLLDRYETYKAALDLAPGQRADLTARLNPHTEPLTSRWWFWTGAAAVVAGGVVATYFLTRPAPQAPPYDSGSANWLVHGQTFRW